MNQRSSATPLLRAGLVLGMGMGGFIDGIVFHQILQMHGMLSARIPLNDLIGSKINMFWDGVFHLAVWLLTAAGIFMLWHAGARTDLRWCGVSFVGSLLLGWGLFNLVEGLVDHHLLQLHHVYEPAGQSVWDLAFLGSGALLIAIGLMLIRRQRRKPPESGEAHA